MSLLNSSIATIMPYLPKWFARPFAKPYVAGETTQSVIEKVKELNNNGFSTTIDILGEHVDSDNEAKNIFSIDANTANVSVSSGGSGTY